MKRLIAILLAILALIIGGRRTKVTVTSDFTHVSSDIVEEQASIQKAPADAAMSLVLPLEDDAAIDIDKCEIETETTDCAPLPEPIVEEETESTEMLSKEKEALDILSSADDPDVELVIEAVPSDSGDRVTAETDIVKSAEPAITKPEKIPEAATEPAPAVVSDNAHDPVTIPIEPTIDTFPADENYLEQRGGTNVPVFINPCRGGSNPFDDDIPSDIDDHSLDEFVGDGDRPGEGIHF